VTTITDPDYGSLQNLLAGNAQSAPPVAGEGATVLWWSDRHAATVLRVSPSGKTAWVREDRAIRTDAHGMSDSQSYRYEPDPAGREHVAHRKRDGRWQTLGGQRIQFGARDHYHDYAF
jgi:hypothetical protein